MAALNDEDLKRNVKDKDTWLRFAFLVLFCAIFYILAAVTFFASLVQFLSKLFSGHTIEAITHAGENLATYQGQVSRYLTYASDERPFPFAPFPEKAAPVVVTEIVK